jgi:dihydroorotate dehydrogenase electron transfer subunit
MVEQPKTLRIAKIIDEAKDIRSFIFDSYMEVRPGQFVMLWLPRVDQKPIGVSYHDDETFGITVQKVGSFTEKIFDLKEGDLVGIAGPYGKPFDTRGTNIALVGGGFGSAPLAYHFESLKKMNKEVFFIVGARNEECLVYKDRFKEMAFCTDDGSHGTKGFTTDLLDKMITEKKIDMVYTCGPEKMMTEVIKICDKHGIDCQVSMERYMKCGFGICGQCCIDPSGVRVCMEGPVFDKEEVKTLKEFGSYKRDGTGCKKDI